MTILLIIALVVVLGYGLNLASGTPAARHVGARARLAEARLLLQDSDTNRAGAVGLASPTKQVRTGLQTSRSQPSHQLAHWRDGHSLGLRHASRR